MLELLQSLSVADAIRRSTWMFPAIEVLHLTGIALLFGTILVADLTLLGLLRSSSLKAAAPSILAVTKTGIVLAVISGGLLFISDPLEFWSNPAFRLKVASIAIAVVNALLFQGFVANLVQRPVGQILYQVSVAMSLVLWSAILILGRAIAYVQGSFHSQNPSQVSLRGHAAICGHCVAISQNSAPRCVIGGAFGPRPMMISTTRSQ